jgi:signal peptidase II
MNKKTVASALGLSAALIGSTAALIALDQWTKALAESRLAGRGAVRLLGDFVILIYTKNRGAFLSLGSGLSPAFRTILLVALPIGALVFLCWALLAKGLSDSSWGRAGRAAAVLVFAGGAGNLIDRIAYGEVRDFLNFRLGSLPPTGIMNFADLYILAALVVIVAATLRRSGKKEGPGSDPREGEGDSPGGEA